MQIENFGGSQYTRGDAGFEDARKLWNGMIDRSPAMIARCNSVEDVVAAVRHAAAKGLQAVARCGGHSVSGASLPADGLMIDLAGLRTITVDEDARIAQVGGGCLLGELDAATQEHGLAVTAGIEPETGVGGLTLGGGIGFLARKLGLTIDNLASAQVVLADGSVVTASKDEHEDLFWALRGGGGQFGIVTRFDFHLHPVGPMVMAAQAFYPLHQAKPALQWLREFLRDAPDEIGVATSFMRVPPVEPPFPAEFHGQPCLVLVAFHLGNDDAAAAALQPFCEQGETIFSFVAPMPYIEFQKSLGGASPKGGRYYWKSHFIPEMNDEVIDIMIDAAKSIPGEYTQIFTEAMGGAVGRVDPGATAFGNRTAAFNLGISCGWADPAMDDDAMKVTRDLFDALAPHGDGGVYLNYVDRDEVERARSAFGDNFDRIVAIKRKYDPGNLFGGMVGGAR